MNGAPPAGPGLGSLLSLRLAWRRFQIDYYPQYEPERRYQAKHRTNPLVLFTAEAPAALDKKLLEWQAGNPELAE